jgi:hypothetical protein
MTIFRFKPTLIDWASINLWAGVRRLTLECWDLAVDNAILAREVNQRAVIREQDWAVNSDPERYDSKMEEGPWAGTVVVTKTPKPITLAEARRRRDAGLDWQTGEPGNARTWRRAEWGDMP